MDDESHRYTNNDIWTYPLSGALSRSDRLPVETNTWYRSMIKWKHFPCYWTFVRGIHRPPMNSPHKGQWRGALMFSLICAWINGWVNNRAAGDLRRYRAHYDVTVMQLVPIRFWRTSHGRMVSMLVTAVDGEKCLWDAEVMGTKPHPTSKSNSQIIGIYPVASARTHVIMSFP